ncbi:MAG TPA: glycolate oxidase subunit GlcE [Trinickia sp.]|jgi:glycolate oxidase FAD binding subunit|uniref:glycolate oxidase subunit GlcE n=1 Tax=Trinickia sp. TaxID=2571163 RepID=UPI002B809445|nr:glycolate oxidase subunit GlcE [Trinickia sp.]HVW52617.1 glycolate oxidase subunit GlcE [Trinickia sp.]
MQRDFEPADRSASLIEQVQEAIAARTPLRIRGGDTKAGLGRPSAARELDTRAHCGIVSYDPTELVVTARAGTTLAELQAALDEGGQMLACEPPAFGGHASVGGMVAAGLSGPRRPWAGAVRDFVLGCRIVTGQGKHLRFGGEVMKNVAGYDVSRLLAGSFGCLGVITEVSLKVLPKPRAMLDTALDMPADEMPRALVKWRDAGLPVTGACHADGVLHLRLEGSEGTIRAAAAALGGQQGDGSFWRALRESALPFFGDPRPLWRLSVAPGAPLTALPGDALLDWGGAQRWLKSEASAETVREIAVALGGHATCFSPGRAIEPFHPLPAPLMRIHRQLKAQLDPHGVFNPGRLYAAI